MKRSDKGAIIIDDPPSEEYEQACLKAVRRQLFGGLSLERDGVIVKGVQLVQSEDCRCIVAFLIRRGKETRAVWRLYEDVWSGTLPRGQAEDPEGVATQMWLWAMGA